VLQITVTRLSAVVGLSMRAHKRSDDLPADIKTKFRACNGSVTRKGARGQSLASAEMAKHGQHSGLRNACQRSRYRVAGIVIVLTNKVELHILLP
jgi:hypothetical protein